MANPGDSCPRGVLCATRPRAFMIFEEFRQVDGSLMRHGEAGLGLAVAHELATLTEGTITGLNQPGVGSTFTLHLPSTVRPITPQDDLGFQVMRDLSAGARI